MLLHECIICKLIQIVSYYKCKYKMFVCANRGRPYANKRYPYSLFTWSIMRQALLVIHSGFLSFHTQTRTHKHTNSLDIQVSLYFVRWSTNPNSMIPSLGLLSKQLLISAPLLPNGVSQ